MSTVNASYNGIITARETVTGAVSSNNADNTISHSGINTELALGANSNPVVDEVIYLLATLSGGAFTLDLTALTGVQGAIDLTGKKVHAMKVKNPVGNGALTISSGAATPYHLLGSAFGFILPAPGANIASEFQCCFDEGAPDVTGSLKHIDFAGTGSETFEIQLLAS